MNLDDDLHSQIFDVLNSENWESSNMKKYMRLRAKKMQMMQRLNALYSKKKRQEQKQKKSLKQKNDRMKELLDKISNSRKKKEKKKDPFTKTLVIGPEDLARPDLIHKKVEADATRHIKMKKLLSKMGSGKSDKSH